MHHAFQHLHMSHVTCDVTHVPKTLYIVPVAKLMHGLEDIWGYAWELFGGYVGGSLGVIPTRLYKSSLVNKAEYNACYFMCLPVSCVLSLLRVFVSYAFSYIYVYVLHVLLTNDVFMLCYITYVTYIYIYYKIIYIYIYIYIRYALCMLCAILHCVRYSWLCGTFQTTSLRTCHIVT